MPRPKKPKPETAMFYEVDRILTASTSHITAKDAEYLAQQSSEYQLLRPATRHIVAYAKSSYGYFVWVPSDRAIFKQQFAALRRARRQRLVDLFILLRVQQCTWLCLDRDGPVYPGLKTYRW